MEVHISWTRTGEYLKGRTLEDLLLLLPKGIHERARRYKRKADGIDFLVGRLLLKEALEAHGIEEGIEDIEFSEKGKPLLKTVFFNISHTEDMVVCAFSKEVEMGIDVEKRKPVDLENFKDFFKEAEWENIKSDDDSIRQFYWHWTRKESILKAKGLDLSDLNKLDVDVELDTIELEEEKWILDQLGFDEAYDAAICVRKGEGLRYVFHRR